MAMKRGTHDPDEFYNYEGKANPNKSDVRGRMTDIHDVLKDENADTATDGETVDYPDMREALANKFVERYQMKLDGAVKVAGDNWGRHGLQLRKRNDQGIEVIFLKAAWVAANRAVEIINALPDSASDKQVLDA